MTTNQALKDAAERWKKYGGTCTHYNIDRHSSDDDNSLLATYAANLITSPPPATDERTRHAEAESERHAKRLSEASQALESWEIRVPTMDGNMIASPGAYWSLKNTLDSAALFFRGNVPSTTKEQTP